MSSKKGPNLQERAGRYVQQPQGYKAFMPNPLPPAPPVVMDDEMWTLVSKADRAVARLDVTTEIVPDPDIFVYMYVRKEAVLSSQIEGTQSSLTDLLEFEAERQDMAATGSDVQDIVDYVAAMNHGLDRLRTLPVSLRLIREIHARLLAHGRGSEKSPGEFRRSQNWIGVDSGRTFAPGRESPITRAKFVPPPPAEMRSALGDLEKFIHDTRPMPALVKLGLIHAQFETIHPFLDGNGRIGRLLITFLLCKEEILRQPLLYLSYYFKLNRAEYYERLQAIRNRGDWEGWLRFFLTGISVVSREACEVARRIVRLREEHRELILQRLGKGARSALRLLESLYRQPYLTTAVIAQNTDLSTSPANTLAGRLCELGILRESTGNKRNRLFRYDRYVSLFDVDSDDLDDDQGL